MMKAVRGEPPSSRGGNQSSVTESWVTLLARSLPEGGPGLSVTHTHTLVLILSPLPVSLHHITLGSHFEYGGRTECSVQTEVSELIWKILFESIFSSQHCYLFAIFLSYLFFCRLLILHYSAAVNGSTTL